jgi:hypothetical protein
MKILTCLLLVSSLMAADQDSSVVLENDALRLRIEKSNGSISSFFIKENLSEMIGEQRLQANFRILLPLADFQANYIDGMLQKPTSVEREGNKVTVRFSGLSSEKGVYPLDLSYTITLHEDYVSFKSRLVNNACEPVAEFWFPRLGGWTQFGNRQAKLAMPNYTNMSRHSVSLFKNYPGARGLGAEAAEWAKSYPGMVMPWWDFYDKESDCGLYLGYHDETFRYSTWHTYLMPDCSGKMDAWLDEKDSAGLPVGIIFSHIRYPFIHSGEIFDSGEFIIRVHKGDWHTGSSFYRQWFMQHFPFDKSRSWLRQESAWFTSIIYQPEDKIIADFNTYDQWCREASKYDINCFELIGWHRGGLERNYPDYQPEEKLGGRQGFCDLFKSIDERNGKCLAFVNYNILDQNTEWYKTELFKFKQTDQFGQQNVWMGWGESTFLARSGLNVRYHVRSSITPEFEKILADQFVQLVKDGAHGFQIDKLCVGAALDFNSLNTLKPDVALCEGLVQAIDRLNKKCQAINPDFRMASEFAYDRLIPYFDVSYRGSISTDISTFRFLFPEWTSCQHISNPGDITGINFAVLTGQVICVEPGCYQVSLNQPLYRKLANYIKEVERIRKDLHEVVFYARYYDDQGGQVTTIDDSQSASLPFSVHGHFQKDQRAMVVINNYPETKQYIWKFTHKKIQKALLYQPFAPVRTINQADTLEIKPEGLHIIVEK